MADNWDRLKARADPDAKLPVATSSKSASNQLEFGQARQARRSRKIENADTDPPIETSLVVAPKRSGTPLPTSFFEANKKKKKMLPPQQPFDNSNPKLPMEVATSKKLEKSELEQNQNKENSKGNENMAAVKGGKVPNPLSKAKAQDPAAKPASSVADIEEASFEPMEIAARGLLGPSGNDEYFLEQFHKFYADYKACNANLAKRLHNLETINVKKHFDVESLKSRLNIMTDRNSNLDKRVALEEQLNIELHAKYVDALKARTTIEKESESLHEKAKAIIDQQMAELGENQSEIANLRAKIEQKQETIRDMAGVLSELQETLKNTEETSLNLLKKANEQAETLEEQKLKMQDAAAKGEILKGRISYLESELEKRTLECKDLQQRKVDIEVHNEEIKNQLETVKFEKETAQNFLAERLKDLEAGRVALIDINEEYSRESDQLKAEMKTLNETISILRSTAIQQAHNLKELTESKEQFQEANLQQLSLHSAEIQKSKAQILNLEEIIKSLENKLQVQAETVKAEKENLIKETQKGELLKSEFEGERERYQADIDALKTALEHRDNESSAEQAKMQSLEAEMDELKKINSSLQEENKQKDTDITTAKKTFDEEIKNQSNNLMEKIIGLQEDLKQKEIKLVGLEHEKNGIIKQLKEKMLSISSTIEQPIIASGLPRSPEPKKSLGYLPRNSQQVKSTVVNSPPSSSRKRKARKFDYINIQSDFESEDDEIPVKMLFAKRENLAVVKPQEDLFDTLKKQTP